MKSLKNKLRNKELTIGSWISFSYPPMCEMMAKAGFDWLVVDMEHSAIDFENAQHLIQIIDLAGCIPLVRVGANDPLIIKRVMDAGARGVVIPMVNTKEDAERAINASYYPPVGTRGVGLSRAQKYGLGFHEYQETAKEETVVIVQIEHIKAVENIDDILSVAGVDGFIIGPYDLSGSLGQPGNFDYPTVKEALCKVESVMANSKKVGGYHVVHSDHDELMNRISQGYKFVAYGVDMVFFAEKLRFESAFIKQNKIRR